MQQIFLIIIIMSILYYIFFKENFVSNYSRDRYLKSSGVAFNAKKGRKKSGGCFLYDQTVKLESGNIKQISQVKIGDCVLCVNSNGELVYSDVVYIPHDFNHNKNTFIEIITNTNKSLKITQCHLIPTVNNIIPAKDLAINDKIITLDGIETIKEINVFEDNGFYTIITNDEYLVVNNIVVSPFGGGMNHTVAHKLCNVFRSMYNISSDYDKSKFIQTNLEALYYNHLEQLLV